MSSTVRRDKWLLIWKNGFMRIEAAGMNLAINPAGGPVAAKVVQSPPVAGIFAEITAGLSNGEELESMLGQFLGPILCLAGAQAGLVRTLSDDGEHMRLVGERGLPEDVRLAELSVDRHCGTCGIAADSDALTWAADLHSCARQNQGGDYFGQHCKRMLAVPLRHREQLLGVYNLFFENDAELGPDIQPVLRSIGELLGLALYNARLERQNLRSTVMNERRFLASEVHDSIAQTLVYVNMRLPLLHDAMLQHDDQRSLRYFSDVEQAVGDIHANLREIMANFRTGMDPQGLLHALQGIAEEFIDRTGIALEFVCDETDLGLSAEQEVQVFHIVQEALANIGRHSQARQARLIVRRGERQIGFLIDDDGRGLADGVVAGDSHFGLGIMKERTQRLGGTIAIGPRAGGGTLVHLTVPEPGVHGVTS
ncbi:MAG: GAF domain-containing protein [Burkholderiales bacterium]|nr:GAF domain-containing protein [Burkholderiales bacterium]